MLQSHSATRTRRSRTTLFSSRRWLAVVLALSLLPGGPQLTAAQEGSTDEPAVFELAEQAETAQEEMVSTETASQEAGEFTAEALQVNDELIPPVLLEPLDDARPVFTPTFKWSEVEGIDAYRLEYTSDPTCNFGAGLTTVVETVNVTYTPLVSFPNDVEYCWRVQTRLKNAVSPFSPTRTFIKHWYIQPEPLTPTNGYQYVRDPLLSWTPVPDAARYKVEVSPENSFPPKNPGWTVYTTNPFNWKPDKAVGGVWYWRVTPVDHSKNEGKPSRVFSFRGVHPNAAYYPVPQLVHPLYYYTPNDLHNPAEDRTVGLPVFTWHRTFTGLEQREVKAYRLQVDDDGGFGSVDWTVDTENLSASPTLYNPFIPDPNFVYHWRVCALDGLGGQCLRDPDNDQELWSEVWQTRIDLSRTLTPTPDSVPVPLLPEHQSEVVETLPLFEWQPVQGAAGYEIQVSTEQSFDPMAIAASETVPYPTYTPQEKLDYYPQDPASGLPYGTYWWRVRALDATGEALGDWSPAWQFQVAAQSHWLYQRYPGDPANRWQIASDTMDGLPAGYELTDLYASQSSEHWFFGFHATRSDPSRTYGLYLDLTREADTGMFSDPRSNPINTIDGHQPEYAIYVTEGVATFSFTPENVFIYARSGPNWAAPQSLVSLGGDMFPSRLNDVAVAVDGSHYTVGRYGAILHGSGGSWQIAASPTSRTLNAIDLGPGGELWAVGEAGTVLRWDPGTQAWQAIDSKTSQDLNAVQVNGPGSVVVAGTDRTIRRWDGDSWRNDSFAASINADLDLYAIDGDWVVGQGGKILHYVQVSSTRYEWQEAASPTTNNLRSVSNLSSDEGWVVGDGGVILHRSGATWSPEGSPTTQNLRDVAVVSATDAWVVGLNGTILRWDGSSWTEYSSPTSRHLYGIRMLSESEGWIVGDNGANLYWDGAEWSPAQDPIANYIELMVPSTAIGMEAETGSAAVSLFSIDEPGGLIQDIVPSGDTAVLDRFAGVSERMTPAWPLTNESGRTEVFHSAPPFQWHYPPVVPWEGYKFEVAMDEKFTSIVYSLEVVTRDPNPPYLAAAFHTPPLDFTGDNTYYWRVRPQYWLPGNNLVSGAWSEPRRFERLAFVPGNLRVTFNLGQPTFHWGCIDEGDLLCEVRRVDGAAAYELQVDDDPNFGKPEINNVTTAQTTYTHLKALPAGTYYWRVRAVRINESGSKTIKGDWSEGRIVIEGGWQAFLPVVTKP